MTEPRITNQRRLFVEALGKYSQTTFGELKKELIGKKPAGIDLATLYRIVNVFKEQGLIHEIEIAGERVIFPCKAENTTSKDSVTLTFCENCGAIYDEHEPLPANYIKKCTHARISSCKACVIK